MSGRRLVAVLVLFLVPALAEAAEDGVPLPRGWIGTTTDWVRGFGIAFVLLNVVLVALAWRNLRKLTSEGVISPCIWLSTPSLMTISAFLSLGRLRNSSAYASTTAS